MTNLLKVLKEIPEFMEAYWGKNFVTLIKAIFLTFSFNQILTYIGDGFEYSALWNYFSLVIFSSILGYIDRRREE
jgi:hypothetical protein